MENRIRKNPKAITGKQYLILGRPAGHVFFCLIAIFNCLYCIITPLFYGLETNFPAEQDIHYSEGLFTYRKAVGKNYQIGVRTDSNTEFFSCKSSYLGPNLCEIDRKYYKQLETELEKNNKRTNIVLAPILYQQWQGKSAKVGWFWQQYSLFGIERRVIQVIVDGKEVVPKENVKKSIISNKDDLAFDIAMSLPIILFTFIITRQVVLNKDNKNER